MSTEGRRTGEGQLELLGISHKTAPIDVLERLALTRDEVRTFVQRLEAVGIARDVAVLSTCNRTEIYLQPLSEAPLDGALTDELRGLVGAERFPSADHLYRAHGREAVGHLFRVACGLDSLVVGEAQILGQVKDAFEETVAHRAPTRTFDDAFRAALKVGGRARAETDIGKGAVSVASAAVHLATRFYADMSDQTVLVVGAGDTGRLFAEHIRAHEPKRLIITNRTHERAERLAREVEGEAAPFETLAETMVHADIIACAVRVTTPLVTPALVEKAADDRAGRPLLFLDLGLPRNVDPAVGGVANVFVHDIEALKHVVDSNLSRRRKELPRVEAMIERELDRISERQRINDVGPLIAGLRDAVEVIRQAEVERACRGLSEAERCAVERATRAVVNKMLHGPMTSIKRLAQQADGGVEQIELVRKVFGNLGISAHDD